MTTKEQTNNKVVKIYKEKRNSSSFLLNNEMELAFSSIITSLSPISQLLKIKN